MTKNYEISPEKIKENIDKFESLCKRLGDRSENVLKMIEHLGERLALCPASARVEHHSCFPGGLVDHSLRVLTNAGKLAKTHGCDFPLDSLIISCLFHDLGKVGDETDDYYVPQKSDWHRDKGMLYEYNENITYMSVPHRSTWLLQQFDVRLSKEEYLAILLNDGQYVEANKPYAMREPMLSMIVHQADAFSTLWEKTNLK
jgi:hypothetical protein